MGKDVKTGDGAYSSRCLAIATVLLAVLGIICFGVATALMCWMNISHPFPLAFADAQSAPDVLESRMGARGAAEALFRLASIVCGLGYLVLTIACRG